jgi:hypothetical protein
MLQPVRATWARARAYHVVRQIRDFQPAIGYNIKTPNSVEVGMNREAVPWFDQPAHAGI